MFLFIKTIYFQQCSKQDIFFKAILGTIIKSTLLLRTIIPDLSVWLTGLKMLLMEWQGIVFEGLVIFICICICICMEWQGIGFEGLVICIWFLYLYLYLHGVARYWIWGVGCSYLFVGDPFPSIFKHCLIFKTYFQFWSDFFQIPGTLVGKGTLPSRLQGIFNLIFFYFVSKYNVLFQGWTCLRSQG